jgi:hypothetical protein
MAALGSGVEHKLKKKMNMKTQDFRTFRFALIVVLAAMLVPALGLAVYAQQEVDPTWYDPWATQPKVVVHPAKSPAQNRERRQNTGAVSPRSHSKKARVKLPGSQREGVMAVGH